MGFLGGILEEIIVGGGGVALLWLWRWFRAAMTSLETRLEEKYQKQLSDMQETNREDRNKLETLNVAMDAMKEKLEDQTALIAHYKKDNTLLITQQMESAKDHQKRIDRLIEVEKKLTEVTVSLDRTEAQLAGERVQKVTLEDKVVAMRKELTEAEREMFRFQGYKQAVKEVFDTFKVKLDYTPVDPLNGDDDPTPSGPGGGGGKDDEKTIPITDAIGKPIPEDKAA